MPLVTMIYNKLAKQLIDSYQSEYESLIVKEQLIYGVTKGLFIENDSEEEIAKIDPENVVSRQRNMDEKF